MFNKHGRQTPLKTGAGGLLNRAPTGLSSMIPMLASQGGTLGRHPMAGPTGAGQNPFWNHNRNIFNLKAQEHAQEALRSRFNALSASQALGTTGGPGSGVGTAQLEQIQFLQEQAQLMAAQMANTNNSLGNDGPMRENPLSSAPNTALLAQIAAQMRAFQAQNNLIGSPGNIIDSTGQSLNTTPDDDENDLNQTGNEFKQEPKPEKEEACTITEMPASPEDKHTETNQTTEPTGEMIIEPTSPDATPTGSPTRETEMTNHESTRLDILDEDIDKKSPNIGSPSPIKVPTGSENSEEIGASDGENRENSRKRKAEAPLDYSINETLFQQRLQHQGRQLPFPYPISPFTVSNCKTH